MPLRTYRFMQNLNVESQTVLEIKIIKKNKMVVIKGFGLFLLISIDLFYAHQ